jgi:MFS family permease
MIERRAGWRLAAMMALVYAVQGSFWPLLAVHLQDLGLNGRSRGWIFATLAMGSVIVPLGAGQLVDRLMRTQRFLALAYGLGAALLALLASGSVIQEGWLFLLFLAFWMIIAPSYGLCNSLAMRHLDDPGRQFGGIRLWGTIGWMAVGWLVSLAMGWTGVNRTGGGCYEAFLIAMVLSIIVALYCLTLPDTPPLARDSASSGWAGLDETLGLFRKPDVRVFLVTALGVYLTTPMVYQVMPAYLESRGLPRAWVPTAMTLGQWPEIAALAFLPWMLGRIGTKGTLAVGIIAWLVRFLSLLGRPPLAIAVGGGLLHGVGVGCFTVGGQVFLDSRAPTRQRASAQGLFLVLTSGLGSLLGNLMAGDLAGTHPDNDVLVFLIPCVINGAMLIYFLTGFRSHDSTVDRAGACTAELPPRPHSVRGTVGGVGNLVTEPADG